MVISLRAAERDIARIVIDLHYLAGQISCVTVSSRLRGIADALNDASLELRKLDCACGGKLQPGQKCPSC